MRWCGGGKVGVVFCGSNEVNFMECIEVRWV